jgi:hypothetical protein
MTTHDQPGPFDLSSAAAKNSVMPQYVSSRNVYYWKLVGCRQKVELLAAERSTTKRSCTFRLSMLADGSSCADALIQPVYHNLSLVQFDGLLCLLKSYKGVNDMQE